MKKAMELFMVCLLSFGLFSGCYSNSADTKVDAYYEFIDDIGNSVILPKKPERVVSLFGSYSELWLLAGGALVGVTEDCVLERGMQLEEGVQIIGSVQNPNLELIMEQSPDFILLSAELSVHRELDEVLTQGNLPHAYMKMNDVQGYLNGFKHYTNMTQRPDLYEQYGNVVKAQVEKILEEVPSGEEKPKVLLIRSMATKAKALKEDHMVGNMLLDLKTDNIASRHASMLEDLSMETILDENPDYIFVIPAGDVDAAIQTLENSIMANPAWNRLSAVQNDHYYVLPKDLFQYKPNSRWGESYEYLYKILYS